MKRLQLWCQANCNSAYSLVVTGIALLVLVATDLKILVVITAAVKRLQSRTGSGQLRLSIFLSCNCNRLVGPRCNGFNDPSCNWDIEMVCSCGWEQLQLSILLLLIGDEKHAQLMKRSRKKEKKSRKSYNNQKHLAFYLYPWLLVAIGDPSPTAINPCIDSS